MVRPILAAGLLILLASDPALAQRPSESAPDRAWWDTLAVEPATRRPWQRRSTLITVRDGVRLAADVYLPADRRSGERLPVLLEQTRYFRSYRRTNPELDARIGPPLGLIAFVEAGYGVVVVDVRGTGASFGSRLAEFSPAEIDDGWDVVTWIAEQPWSNGAIGSTGVSYPGTTAEFLGTLGHPAVKAVAPRFSLTDLYADVTHPGGIFLEPFFRTWETMVRHLDANEVTQAQRALTTGVRPAADGAEGERLLADAIRDHQANQYLFGQLADLRSRDHRMPNGWPIDTISPHIRYAAMRNGPAVYNWSGWVDGGFGYAAIKRFLTAPNPRSRLLLGPWNHGGAWVTEPGQPPYRSAFRQLEEMRRFFDLHLRPGTTAPGNEPPVRYFTTGENRWKTSTTWPPATRDTVLHAVGSRRLAAATPAAGMLAGFQVDTMLGTGGASRWNTILGGGAVQYAPLDSAGPGIIAFSSEPLPHPLTITGHPVVTIRGRYSDSDPTLFVYLEQVDSSGRSALITEGQLRLIHRRVSPAPRWHPVPAAYHSFLAADTIAVPIGEPVEAVIELLPVSHQVPAGNRLRLQVRGADRDHFLLPVRQWRATILGGTRVHLPIE